MDLAHSAAALRPRWQQVSCTPLAHQLLAQRLRAWTSWATQRNAHTCEVTNAERGSTGEANLHTATALRNILGPSLIRLVRCVWEREAQGSLYNLYGGPPIHDVRNRIVTRGLRILQAESDQARVDDVILRQVLVAET